MEELVTDAEYAYTQSLTQTLSGIPYPSPPLKCSLYSIYIHPKKEPFMFRSNYVKKTLCFPFFFFGVDFLKYVQSQRTMISVIPCCLNQKTFYESGVDAEEILYPVLSK